MTLPLIALTSYYNPFRGERRRRNYRVFRENLGVPLVTVEWSPDGHFELSASDADVLIRVDGGDIMWQKERLLNAGLARIRAGGLARDVAIMDADAVFVDEDWPQRVCAALDANPVVQCFERVDYLPQVPLDQATRAVLAQTAPERSMPSVAHSLAQGRPFFTTDAAMVRVMALAVNPAPGRSGLTAVDGNPGFSIGLRLSELPRLELYEGNIVGGGDMVVTAAAAGALDDVLLHRPYMPAHKADVLAWAARCLPGRPVGLGAAANRVVHLWHGTMEARQYARRLHILEACDYDPARDIDRSGGAMRFAPSALALRAAVREYLVSRNDA